MADSKEQDQARAEAKRLADAIHARALKAAADARERERQQRAADAKAAKEAERAATARYEAARDAIKKRGK